ncbi:DUF2924 domain-containing protein [Endozoicomonas atrinae]|uniref:DUF2924 domain-containing protein n=1 Tax=Endozoicomonas atrinae TaxID=1333660 RepID=UPI0008240AF5|nr:DUF2924 domain-containing protein [Endozoicomonas atrinae]
MNDDKILAARVVALQPMKTEELRKLWKELYGKDAPELDLRILQQRLSNRIQELALGGLSEKSSDRLKLASPELLFKVWQQASEQDVNLNENTIRATLGDLASVWDELFTPEKRRLTELLIKRIELAAEQVTVYFRPDGMNAVAIELQP